MFHSPEIETRGALDELGEGRIRKEIQCAV